MSFRLISDMRRLLLLSALSLAAFTAEGRDKAVQVIVPFAPGGGSDTLARVFTRAINEEKLSDVPWVVVNIPGAGGTIGSRRARKAPADGSNLLFLHDGIITAKHAERTLYGPEDFTPIAATGSVGMVICVSEKSPYTDLGSLLDEAAKKPDTITFAANIGAPSYYMARILEHTHGSAAFRYVQSGGGATRFADLSGGHMVASAFSVSEYMSFQSGGLRALAFLGENRHPAMPKIPTAAESGLEVTYDNLQGWWMPEGADPALAEDFANTLSAAMHLKSVQKIFSEQQIDQVFLDGDGLRDAMVQKESSLRSLSVISEGTKLPNLLIPIAITLLVGLVIAGIGGWIQSRKLPSESKMGPRDLFPAAIVVAAYLLLLQFLDGWFLPLSVAFLFVSFLIHFERRDLAKSVLTAVLVPLVLFLFLSTLLSYRLP